MKKYFNNFFEKDEYSIFWFLIRFYVGWQWLSAGWMKVTNENWIGGNSGFAIQKFVESALVKTVGAHPDVSMWYAWFLKNLVLTHTTLWSYIISFGELFVGIGLILGIFTITSAFFGAFMNFNYLLAGTISTNPILLILQILIISAKKVSGRIGLEKYFVDFLKKIKN